ncbi:hypothetical protein PFDSM3638_03235 [Pyrococcus furiosus DSM 3638]|uniref:Uncharacterized protein n=3 Tax=Pyrococcus furiosus TaxID=2261 RepID=Q8U327_PYRFU|nr:hypothetical protein [Pyrococcus furiosus]AAL80772.1 hypothetical protein PF0648 [Pyrococcus furiosus DSM 3638]AFN03438.1 hypothetical protein PFC_02380 [Pyrococcus furiosus COM1]QEK78349.1 hypothetical protein PFDSM3638_03235 [Pyrococcus furiosus DSM 3638]
MASAKTGMWLAILGGLLILLDGILVLANKTFYGWHYGGVSTVGWIEIIFSLIIIGLAYYYKSNKKAIGWSIVVLALITLPFDGGFWTLGAWICLNRWSDNSLREFLKRLSFSHNIF